MLTIKDLEYQGYDAKAAEQIVGTFQVFARHAAAWAKRDIHVNALLNLAEPEQRAAAARYINVAIYICSDRRWKKRLTGLATALGAFTQIDESLFRLSLGRGDFDYWKNKRLIRPPVKDVQDRFFTQLRAKSTVEDRANALVRSKLCRNKASALRVANLFKQRLLILHAVHYVRNIINCWGTYGLAALLQHSDHPLAEEHMLLERVLLNLPEHSKPPENVIALTRKTIIALAESVTSVNPSLWQQHLLTEPLASSGRALYEQRLPPFSRESIAVTLANKLFLPQESAQAIVESWLARGIDGILSFCWDRPHTGQQVSLERLRFLKMAREHIDTVTDHSWQKELTRLVTALADAMEQSQIGLSYTTFIHSRPSSRRRIAWGRRLSFGVPALIRRRHSKDTKSKQKLLLHAKEKILIQSFAQAALLDEKDATHRLRSTVSRGIIGLVPQFHQSELFDYRVVNWLKSMREGHPRYARTWSEIYAGLKRYAEDYAIPLPSSQLAEAYYHSLSLDRYWFGGKGIAVLRVHQEGKRTITDRPRLHATWKLLHIPLRLSVLNQEQTVVVPQSHFLLLVDDEAELPIGGRLFDRVPAADDVLLTLYDSIWRPNRSWPLRGMPNQLVLSKHLLTSRSADLERAAANLLIDVEFYETVSLSKRPRLQRIVASIKDEGLAAAQHTINGKQPTAVQISGALLEFLAKTFLPAHRGGTKVQPGKLAIAGRDTPGAGWLLPVVNVQTADVVQPGGVVFEGQRYTAPFTVSLVGQAFRCRQYPYYYPERDAGLFIEIMNNNQVPLLHHLERRD